MARIQADAETKAGAKGNAGGHAILTAKVKPHVDFTFSNPVKDLTSVQIQVRVYPAGVEKLRACFHNAETALIAVAPENMGTRKEPDIPACFLLVA